MELWKYADNEELDYFSNSRRCSSRSRKSCLEKELDFSSLVLYGVRGSDIEYSVISIISAIINV